MDLTILTFKNGVEKYWPVKSPELPEDVIAFKYLKEVSAEYDDYLITNYRIGVPIDKPMVLTKDELKFDLENDGEGMFAYYVDGDDRRIITVEKNTALVDDYDALAAAYFSEATFKRGKGL